jgi:muramoyltetrapeptide carboxypeptidase
VLERVEGPIGIGLRSGHVSHGNVTLAFGMQAELNLEREPKLAFLEPATEN